MTNSGRKKGEENVRKDRKVKLSDSEFAKIKKLAKECGINTRAKYMREIALQPEKFAGSSTQGASCDDFSLTGKMEKNRATTKVKEIYNVVTGCFKKQKSILYSATKDETDFKLEGDDFILVFRKKKVPKK